MKNSKDVITSHSNSNHNLNSSQEGSQVTSILPTSDYLIDLASDFRKAYVDSLPNKFFKINGATSIGKTASLLRTDKKNFIKIIFEELRKVGHENIKAIISLPDNTKLDQANEEYNVPIINAEKLKGLSKNYFSIRQSYTKIDEQQVLNFIQENEVILVNHCNTPLLSNICEKNQIDIVLILDESHTLISHNTEDFKKQTISEISTCINEHSSIKSIIEITGTPFKCFEEEDFTWIIKKEQEQKTTFYLNKINHISDQSFMNFIEKDLKKEKLVFIKYNNKGKLNELMKLLREKFKGTLSPSNIKIFHSGNKDSNHYKKMVQTKQGGESFRNNVKIVLFTSLIEDAIDIYTSREHSFHIIYNLGLCSPNSDRQTVGRVRSNENDLEAHIHVIDNRAKHLHELTFEELKKKAKNFFKELTFEKNSKEDLIKKIKSSDLYEEPKQVSLLSKERILSELKKLHLSYKALIEERAKQNRLCYSKLEYPTQKEEFLEENDLECNRWESRTKTINHFERHFVGFENLKNYYEVMIECEVIDISKEGKNKIDKVSSQKVKRSEKALNRAFIKIYETIHFNDFMSYIYILAPSLKPRNKRVPNPKRLLELCRIIREESFIKQIDENLVTQDELDLISKNDFLITAIKIHDNLKVIQGSILDDYLNDREYKPFIYSKSNIYATGTLSNKIIGFEALFRLEKLKENRFKKTEKYFLKTKKMKRFVEEVMSRIGEDNISKKKIYDLMKSYRFFGIKKQQNRYSLIDNLFQIKVQKSGRKRTYHVSLKSLNDHEYFRFLKTISTEFKHSDKLINL